MTSPGRRDDGSSSPEPQDDIPTLEAEITALTVEQQAIEEAIRRFRAEEDFAAGVFRHKEIFAFSQEKLRLEAEIDIRRRRIRRIREGW